MHDHVMGNLKEERSESSLETLDMDLDFHRRLGTDSSVMSGETDDTVTSAETGDSGLSRSSLMYPNPGSGDSTRSGTPETEADSDMKDEQTRDEEKGFAAKSFDLFMDSCSMKGMV